MNVLRYVLMTLALLLASACGAANAPPAGTTPPTSAPPSAQLGRPFTLAPGQTIAVSGEALSVKFIDVTEDSRCPTGATCVWQGEAKAAVEFIRNNVPEPQSLVQPGLTQEPSTATFAGYRVAYDIQPYPKVGETIEKAEYRLELTITKAVALSGGILATFDVSGETYRIFVANPDTIDDIFKLQKGESDARIPSGRLVKGAMPYNAPWSWHIDPADVHLAEITIELCDGRPSLVEADVDHWVDTVKRFCPWGARLVSVEDFR
jgi:hypothetical protein